MLSPIGKIIFGFIIIATFIAFTVPVYFRLKIIKTGRPDNRFNNLAKRIGQALSKILLQRCTLKNERLLTGFMHVFIFYGALTFDTMTINHSLEGFFPEFYLFGNTNFGLFFSFLVDMFAILVIAGVLFFAVKRFILRPEAYKTTPADSAIIYIMLSLVTFSYLYFEMFSVALHPETERLSFLGSYFAGFLENISNPALLSTHLHIAWWVHILLVFGFIAYVPHSKYFHMFAGSFNVLVNSDTPMGKLKAMDIEKAEVFGIEKASDYSWKDLLDPFACMECGRCQDTCPAFSSDKTLSPKTIIYNLRRHLLIEGKKYISSKKDGIKPLMESTFSQDEIWACTTCGACMHVCPVEIEHISKIIGLRQSQVLMESKFPGELNSFFRNIETNSNPWGIGFSERADWKEGLDVKLIKDHPETNCLFWVGCTGSFDEEGKKITRAMANILIEADIEFAILGSEEKCCGDAAKRLGNEYLFQMQAAENIELFNKYNIKKIITTCPHGYNCFKHEYPDLLEVLPDIKPDTKKTFKQIEVIHHSQLLADLIKKGRLPIKQKIEKDFTYHDSCYLGRHNKIISQPRNILSNLFKSKLTELKNNREHSFCCGAGGGLMWTEENSGQRINHLRTNEVIESNTELVVTSCAFCQTMLQDGLKDKDKENIKVKDIAQLIAESLT